MKYFYFRFAKNLSVENINISTFKGEGELNFLELNEIVLTDLLELPTWMRMTSATVNKVKFKIPFTKIKSVPIEFVSRYLIHDDDDLDIKLLSWKLMLLITHNSIL